MPVSLKQVKNQTERAAMSQKINYDEHLTPQERQELATRAYKKDLIARAEAAAEAKKETPGHPESEAVIKEGLARLAAHMGLTPETGDVAVESYTGSISWFTGEQSVISIHMPQGKDAVIDEIQQRLRPLSWVGGQVRLKREVSPPDTTTLRIVTRGKPRPLSSLIGLLNDRVLKPNQSEPIPVLPSLLEAEAKDFPAHMMQQRGR